jgi:hypothetical protein
MRAAAGLMGACYWSTRRERDRPELPGPSAVMIE